MDLKYQLAPTCFVASGAPSSESPKWSYRNCVWYTPWEYIKKVISVVKILIKEVTK
jgi:hypothetical protein